MTGLIAGECHDIQGPGEMKLELEVHRDGTVTVLCPCCGGCGEHDSHAGNDPRNCAYPCRTCGGKGMLNHLPQIRPEEPPGQQPTWKGWRCPAGRLSLAPVPGQPGRWAIRGAPASGHPEASTADLLRMAREITLNLEAPESIERLDWVREYRRLIPRASLLEAQEEWGRAHPGEAEAVPA